jgi:NAD(P)-dependent dehydrogenase (short-subunit alcohol dehydrogenase family)
MHAEKDRPVTVVTGAAGGIGRALVAGLLAQGHDVLAVVRRPPEVALPSGPGRCEVFIADLTEESGRAAVVDAVRTRFGGLWCLINNAGVGMSSLRADYYKHPVAPAEIDGATLARFMKVNAEAPMALTIALLPHFRGGAGRIVNVGTSLTAMLRRGFMPYAMSKAALEAGTAVLARDLEGSGITVHLVHPGGSVDTPMARRDEPELRAALLAPESMVAPVCWLASPAGAAHHGERLNTRFWRADNPDAGFDPIAWPQLAGDSAWGVGAATSTANPSPLT